MATSSTRSAASLSPSKQKRKFKTQKPTATSKPKHKRDSESDDHGEEEDNKDLDSDALDEDEDQPKMSKRKRVSPSKKVSPRKKRSKKSKHSDEDDEEDHNFELAEGQQIVGVIVKAPQGGRVPPGQISQNTFNFLGQLRDPKCNDREWFKLNEPVYRLAETEWKDFVQEFTTLLTEVDPQVPHLPPKDVIHRIYRDIRFSNDKTPYKTCFSAGFSRSGRKGIFAGFQPGGHSIVAGGSWCPGKNELATIRSHILRSSVRLRTVLAAPAFVSHFGLPKPDPKGQKQSIFGRDDELKVAPKGIPKDHKDIDLLKCRSFAVVHRFKDEEVLSPDFKEEVSKIIEVIRPLVHCLNDMMTLPADDDDVDDDEDEGEEGGEA